MNLKAVFGYLTQATSIFILGGPWFMASDNSSHPIFTIIGNQSFINTQNLLYLLALGFVGRVVFEDIQENCTTFDFLFKSKFIVVCASFLLIMDLHDYPLIAPAYIGCCLICGTLSYLLFHYGKTLNDNSWST